MQCGAGVATLLLAVVQVGVTYVIKAQVGSVASASSVNAATVTLSVVSAGIDAVIADGDRLASIASPLVLNAGGSKDLDRVAGATLSFAWWCDNCTDADPYFGLDTYAAGAVLTIPENALPVGRYRFNVTVSAGVADGLIPNHFRSGTASVVIELVSSAAPLLSTPSSSVVVNPTDARLSLRVSVSNVGAGGVMAWTTPDLSEETATRIILSSSRTQPVLVIRPDLTAGTYAFTFTASNSQATSSVSISVVVNDVPRNGYVDASPTWGYAMTTTFEISALSWTDDGTVSVIVVPPRALLEASAMTSVRVVSLLQDALYYRFAALVGDREIALVSARQLANTLSVPTLPPGDPFRNFTVNLVCVALSRVCMQPITPLRC
jgi:hypothetical protein